MAVLSGIGCNSQAPTEYSGAKLPCVSDFAPGAPIVRYSYEVVNAYPHDPTAFTQGLAYANGQLYEGTGLTGRSTLRRVDLETGEVQQSIELSDSLFGEGIAVCRDRLFQLTWHAGTCFVYDLSTLERLDSLRYEFEGWGLACDGELLVMSDGTSRLYFRDPETFKVHHYVEVHDGRASITNLNELEYINGLVYANVWKTDEVAIIDPSDGRVVAWLDLTGLLAHRPVDGPVDVLNGIAYDAGNDRMFVTGKLWPCLFEVVPIRE